jgi:hypothetical protein
VVDYANDYFLGLRIAPALIRVFARGPFGMPLSVVVHLFDEAADAGVVERAWQSYLDGLFN